MELSINEQMLALTPEFYDTFNSATDFLEEWRLMFDVSQIRHHTDNAKSEIIQEYLFHNLHFCKEHKLNHNDMMAVMKVVEVVYHRCILLDCASEIDALDLFQQEAKRLLLGTDEDSTRLPLDVFAKFSNFYTRHFIRHLKLYQSVLHISRPEVHKTICLSVQSPLIPLPLVDGVSES